MTSRDPNSTPIAVVGIGCRFPGDGTSSEKLWNLLLEKKSALSEVPADRFNVEAFYHPDADRYGTSNTRGGHYLTEDISLFDAPFFSISPAEAMAMDPMQRMLLEVTYEALENSGVTIQNVSGSQTSCFVGCFTKDYEEMQRRDMEMAPKYQSTGASQTLLSNRLSYFFNLKGPSMTLDTACSSGLVAVHLACQSLRTRESSMAVVGGSNLILSPDMHIEMSDMHFLGPDSISYAFDERANGYARGEGVGAVILKPLELALRDNDPIRAVICGTAVSSDGRTSGITMPSKQAQVNLMRSAYRSAGCDVSETGYFEAHGTGTAAGDPIETSAIGEVFAQHRPLSAVNGGPARLMIGSIKTNIGHLEGASGIAGLIKAVLTVERGIIAPNIWFRKGNPDIDFENWQIEVPTETKPWPFEGLRQASVNSFGYGGTNAHVIVNDAFHYLQRYHLSSSRSRADSGFVTPTDDAPFVSLPRPRLFIISANYEQGILYMGSELADYLQTQPKVDDEQLMDRLAYTLSQRRSRLSYGCAIMATNRTSLIDALRKPLPMQNNTSVASRIGFLFTGQGGSWYAMGRELLSYPVFKDSLRHCEEHINRLGAPWSLMEELLKSKSKSRVNEATISQPLCTAIQIALVELLASWNVRPTRVVGHSSGEIAAAYAVGALTANIAMTVAYYRGLLAPKVKDLGHQGSMMAVSVSQDEANKEIAQLGSDVGKAVVACINSPCGVTISGDKSAVEKLHQCFTAKGTFAKVLPVDVAYHSHHMKAIADEYLERLREAHVVAHKSKTSIPMFSSVTESIIQHDQLNAKYWVANLTGCVRFSGAVQKLCQATTDTGQGVDILLEVGPHALFKLSVREILQETFGETSSIQYMPTLIRNKPANVTALETAGKLYTTNASINLRAVNFPVEPKEAVKVLTDLPQYPWNHTRSYWYESRLSRDYRFRKSARNEILGAPSHDWNPMEPRFRNFLRLREQPWLRDHVVQGDVLFPACGYLCMAIEACRYLSSEHLIDRSNDDLEYRLREVSIKRALVVPDTDEGVETCFSMRYPPTSTIASPNTWHEFYIFSYTANAGWSENCRGLVSVGTKPQDDPQLAVECQNEWATAHAKSCQIMDSGSFYAGIDVIGLTYGVLFQGLKDITVNPQVLGRAAGVVEVTNTRSGNPKEYEHERLLHPATFDNFLQLALVSLGGIGLKKLKSAMVPTYVEEISISASILAQIGDRLNVVVSAERLGDRKAKADIIALDPNTSRPVAILDGFKFVAINSTDTSSEKPKVIPKHCYRPVWEPDVELINRPSLDQVLQAAPRPDDRPKTVRELELLAYYFIDSALRVIDWKEVDNMLPHHQLFYKDLRRLQQDVIDKTHPQQTEEWHQLYNPQMFSKLQALVDYYRTHETAYDGKLLVRVGEALPAVFRQEVEPLSLMTHENLLEDYYTTAVGMPNTYAQITRYVSMLSHKYPNLEFLEIGAGTGGATVPTTEGLRGGEGRPARLKSYTYTDISPNFFERAVDKFSDFAQFMEFKKLNVENDPETQDFKPASYDVIVAANVLHATPNMHCTMTYVRKLLRPGGKLILLEMTNRLLAASVIFGTLPGWWNATDGRTGGPLLTETQWQYILRSTGFGSLQASSPDVLDPLEEGTRLIICEAVEQKTSLRNGILTPHESPQVIIVCADSPIKMTRSGEAVALLKKMQASGFDVQILPFRTLQKQDVINAICISFVELDEPLLAILSADDLKSLQHIADTSAGLLWVTRGSASANVDRPELAVFQGLSRSLKAEHERFRCITVDLDSTNKKSAIEVADLVFYVYKKHLVLDQSTQLKDSEFVERGGVLHVKRVVEDMESDTFLAARSDRAILPPRLEKMVQEDRPLKLKLSDAGLSKPYLWEDDPCLSQPLKRTEVEIQIRASSLEAGDISIVNENIAKRRPGHECSGVVTKVGSKVEHLLVGDPVVAWSHDTFSTHVRVRAALVQKIPESISFETAAIVPTAYATAWFSLVNTAHLTAGEQVLIHKAADPIGQAAIHIASTIGADIYGTVNSDEEKAYLVQRFGVPEHHIFANQNTDFVNALRRFTKGHGLDVVINRSSGEVLQATFSCIAPFGRFVDLAKSNAVNNERLEMAPFAKSVSFTSVDMDFLYRRNVKLAETVFQEAMRFFVAHGLDTIPNVNVRPWSKLSEAMELAQGAKIVVMISTADDLVLVAQHSPPPISLDPSASYLLAGGLGGLGRSISRYLVSHGARNLIFLSRSGAISAFASSFIASLYDAGVRTAVLQCDVSDSSTLSTLLSTTLKDFPPIKGVLQLAMTLNDSLFANMTHQQWNDTIRPKVHGSKNLHELTIDQPLDFFILLSSLHSFIGNPGQSNYAAGCSYQVALASYRNTLDLPGVAIDLGIVGDVGYVVEKQDDGKKVKIQDFKHLSEKEMLALIELGIRKPQMGHIVTGLDLDFNQERVEEEKPFFAMDPVLSHLDYLRPHLQTSSTTRTITTSPSCQTLSLAQQINQSTTADQTYEAIHTALIKKLSRSLMMDASEIDSAKAMSAYGTDSLVAVEMKNWVMRETKVSVSVFDVLQSGSIKELVGKVIERLAGMKRSRIRVL